ncbi:MAG: hypothetical protein MZW92_03140 [Comamonadaceae bacterium]|nr:hypothetical protein [Comamonadaceae bacterium]
MMYVSGESRGQGHVGEGLSRGSGRPTTASPWRITATAGARAPSRRGHGRLHHLRLGQRRRGRGHHAHPRPPPGAKRRT